MIKPNATVKNETRYIALFCVILSIIMQIVFIAFGKWTYKVILGNILSLIVAILNFFVMGLTVQRAVCLEETDARRLMRSSQNLRNAGIFIAVVIGVVAPCFNTVAVIVPVFFPRIAVSFRPLIKNRKEVVKK
ncbi:MAG: hypothetical protein IJN40_05455 [Clostridia bacterium]|nr:hypothetical protein [Clostridia bacterium]